MFNIISADLYKLKKSKVLLWIILGLLGIVLLGNILAQMISDGAIKDLNDGRKMIKESFEIKEYKGEE